MREILGVVVDLDDTLYPQKSFLLAAAAHVGVVGAVLGLPGTELEAALGAELLAGSDKGGTIDRALLRIGLSPEESARVLPDLVSAFLSARPSHLECYPGARAALEVLNALVPVACLTDGAPSVQHAKVDALGIRHLLGALVVTDELGGRHLRKPAPDGLLEAARLLAVAPEDLVVVGDRPGKDMAVAAALGARSIRVRTGEYAGTPDLPPATWTVEDFPAAVELLVTEGLSQVPLATPTTP